MPKHLPRQEPETTPRGWAHTGVYNFPDQSSIVLQLWDTIGHPVLGQIPKLYQVRSLKDPARPYRRGKCGSCSASALVPRDLTLFPLEHPQSLVQRDPVPEYKKGVVIFHTVSMLRFLACRPVSACGEGIFLPLSSLAAEKWGPRWQECRIHPNAQYVSGHIRTALCFLG